MRKERDRPHTGVALLRRIYSRCSPFCSHNHHLCALRCSAFVQRQMCARLLHLAASRIEPVCAVFFNFSLSRECTARVRKNIAIARTGAIESVFSRVYCISHKSPRKVLFAKLDADGIIYAGSLRRGNVGCGSTILSQRCAMLQNVFPGRERFDFYTSIIKYVNINKENSTSPSGKSVSGILSGFVS